MAVAGNDCEVMLPGDRGNPKEDGYSHNGDMGAAWSLFALAWTWHALAGELGDERRTKLKAKL